MFPANSLAYAVINNTDTIQGGFINSRMYTVTLPALLTTIRNAFGTTHISAMPVYYPDQFNQTTGQPVHTSSYSVYITLPSECQVYGAPAFATNPYEIGWEATQLSLFRYSRRLAHMMWLRNANTYSADPKYWCYAYTYGMADFHNASKPHNVHPIFNLT